MSGDDVLWMPVARRLEVFTGAGRRRRWSPEEKARIVAESYATSVGEAADRHALRATQLFTWRRDARRGPGDGVTFTPVMVDDASGDGRGGGQGVIEVEIGSARAKPDRKGRVGVAHAIRICALVRNISQAWGSKPPDWPIFKGWGTPHDRGQISG